VGRGTAGEVKNQELGSKQDPILLKPNLQPSFPRRRVLWIAENLKERKKRKKIFYLGYWDGIYWKKSGGAETKASPKGNSQWGRLRGKIAYVRRNKKVEESWRKHWNAERDGAGKGKVWNEWK